MATHKLGTPIRALAFTLLLLGTLGVRAQLVNGSFEDSAGFSLQGWEWTCETPYGGNNVPAGMGQWSVHKNMGTPECPSSYLFQRVPFAAPGSDWAISGWVRTDETGWDALARIGFGRINNGVITTQSWIGNQSPDWFFCWIHDTIPTTDTAIVVLSSGSSFLGAGWFDGIQLEPFVITGIGTPPVRVHAFTDEQGLLHLSAAEQRIRTVRVFDPAGRAVPVQVTQHEGGVTVDAEGSGSGVYVVQVATDAGPATTRFVKP